MLRVLPALIAAVVVAAACAAPDGDPPVAPSPGPTSSSPSAPAAAPSPSPSPSPSGPQPPDEMSAFDDPGELAEALRTAHDQLADADADDPEARAWAWVHQQAYRDLVIHPEWRDAARSALPERLHAVFDRNVHAGEELRALTEPRTELPDWRIVAAPPAEELRDAYETAAAEFGIDWTYLAAIHLVESRMGRIRGTSTAGAQGPMQFLPSTWEAYGEGDIEDPHDAIRAAARYLVDHGAPGDMDRALFAYNHSDRYVAAVSDYATVMREDPSAYGTYYHWRVYYRTVDGDLVLDEGYGA